MLGIFEQPYKINASFSDKSSFEAVMLTEFSIQKEQSSLLYDGYFSYKQKFIYHDIDAFFENSNEYHKFLANPLIVEVN